MTLVGLLLILIVVFAPRGLIEPALSLASASSAGRGGMTNLLEARGVSCSFGGLHVTRDVNFKLAVGDRVALIRPERRWQNHAGQSDHR